MSNFLKLQVVLKSAKMTAFPKPCHRQMPPKSIAARVLVARALGVHRAEHALRMECLVVDTLAPVLLPTVPLEVDAPVGLGADRL